MKKFLFFSILLFGILSFGIAKAVDIFYERTPSGATINEGTPISFSVDNVLAIWGIDPFFSLSYNLKIFDISDNLVATSPCYTSDDQTWTKSDLPVGKYGAIRYSWSRDTDCDPVYSTGGLEEPPSFEVVETPPSVPPIISGMGGAVSGSAGLMGKITSDLAPYIALILGLPFGFWGIRKVIGLVRIK
jgi:hypothetical protein